MPIGRGSTGIVWEARDLLTSETVAIKILHGRLLSSPSARARFLREAETTSVLRHPHCVEVRGHGETDAGDVYLAMERLAGTTLAVRLSERGPLPQMLATKIAAEILDAVEAAHRLNIVHRDLKPGNVVLIDRDGDPDFVKVCDFGLAKEIDASWLDGAPDSGSPVTVQGEICGTPEYMAPEQARGESIDGRADVYAIAALLFQTVVGEPPFRGPSALEVVSRHLSEPPPRPSAVRPDIAIFPPLEDLILRGLAKDRTRRPSSAAVFRAELLQIQRDIQRGLRNRGAARGRGRGTGGSTPETLSDGPQVRPATSRLRRAYVRPALAGALLLGVGMTATFGLGRRGPIGNAGAGARSPASAAISRTLEAPESPRALTPAPTPTPVPVPTLGASAVTIAAVADRSPGGRPSTSPRRARARPAPASTTATKESQPGAVAAGDAPLAIAPAAGPSVEEAEDLLADGRIVEACAHGEAIVRQSSELPAAWELLGRCYTRLGDLAKARACYTRYLELAPTARNAAFVRAILKQRAH